MDYQPRLLKCSFSTLLGSLVVVALLLLPGRAGAAIFNYGTVSLSPPNVFYGQFQNPGSFLDQIQFSVATPFTVTLHDNGTDFSLISSVSATLYNNPAGGPLYSTVGTSFQNLVPSSPLAAGSYELRITGTSHPLNFMDGGYSGYMTLAPTTAPIPEPETYAMMLAGLGLMGFVARRRKRQAAAGA